MLTHQLKIFVINQCYLALGEGNLYHWSLWMDRVKQPYHYI